MASKTSLPIARLRALGCSIGTIPGHWPLALNGPSWQYAITLPKGIAAPVSPTHNTLNGVASASLARDGRIIVRAFRGGDTATRITKAQREAIEADVAGLLSKLADILNGRGA